MRALDLSFSAASLAWCQARKAEGWELLIADLWTGVSPPAPARANLANARQAGMLTAGYTVVNNLPGITAIMVAATPKKLVSICSRSSGMETSSKRPPRP